jgi:hypothetical protein
VVLPVLVPVVVAVPAVVALVSPELVDDEVSPVPVPAVPVPVPVPVPLPLVPVADDEVPAEPVVPVGVVAPVAPGPVVPVEFRLPGGGVSPAAPVSEGSVAVLGGLAVGTMSSPPEIDGASVDLDGVPLFVVLIDLPATPALVEVEEAGAIAGA